MKFKTLLILFSSYFFINAAYANNFQDSLNGDVKLNLNLYLFAADIDGKIKEGNVEYDVDQPFKETIKNLDRSYMGHLDLAKGNWGIYIDKQIVKTSQKNQIFHLPVAVDTKLDQTSYGMYYQAYTSPAQTKVGRSKFIVEPTIGIHHTEADASLSILGKIGAVDKSWDEFFWGSRFKYNFDTPWNFASEVTFGSENTISAQAYLGYRIPVYKHDFNLRVGYRFLKQDYRDDSFHWDITESGPVIGISLPIF